MGLALSNAELIPKGFWETTGNIAKSVGSAIVSAAVWCGHAIKVLFTDIIIPGMIKIWPYVAAGFVATWEFLQTPIGLGTIGLVLGIAAGVNLLIYAHAIRNEKNIVAVVALRIAAVVAFVLGGAAFAFGLATGLG